MNNWIDHKGEEMPVSPSTLVRMRFRSGFETKDYFPADEWHWTWGDSEDGPTAAGDIVAYQLKLNS